MAIPNCQYQSDFGRRYFTLGEAEGERHGRVDLLDKQFARRFGPLPEAVNTSLAQCSVEELDAIGERVLGHRPA